jgi:ZIP family zinc transporter
MSAKSELPSRFGSPRLLALAPLLLLVAVVAAFGAWGDSVTGLVGHAAPPPDQFDVRRVELHPGEIQVRVTNPQRDALTIGSVAVDDAIVPFRVDGDTTLDRLRSSTIVIPYDWVENDPLTIGVTSSTGIETTTEVVAAIETPEPTVRRAVGYGLLGLVVGVLPVALGLLWLPALRHAAPKWLAAFMALTGGLLLFLAVEALAEALDRQARLPEALGGVGIVLLGVATSWLGLTAISRAFTRGGDRSALPGGALALLVAIGIGLHNFGEGLAIGTSFALGELALGALLVVGFMIHNVTEGLGIAAPLADEGAAPGVGRLAALVLIAGGPTLAGAWLGGFVTSDLLATFFFAVAAGAAFQVVFEVVRYVQRRAPGGLGSPYVLTGFLGGIAVMYVTALIAG